MTYPRTPKSRNCSTLTSFAENEPDHSSFLIILIMAPLSVSNFCLKDLFVSSVTTAIGDVTTRIREVTEVCLKGIIALLSNR